MADADSSAIPCIGCHTNCCEAYRVPVSAHDVYRIAQQLQAPPESFLTAEPTLDTESGIRLGDGHVTLNLRKRLDNACVFLLDLDGERRCSIQAFKPAICSMYPFVLGDDGELYHQAGMLCPRPWSLTWGEKRDTRAIIRRWREEQEFDQELVQRWNRCCAAGGTLADYGRFLMAAVAAAEERPTPT